MKKEYFLLCLIFLLIFAGCSKDKNDVKQPEKVNSAASVVSDTEAATTTDSEIDYTKYSETNEKFDSNNRVILSNIYDPDKKFVGYRKYSYLKNGEISEMQTFTADDKLKSTLHYDYSAEDDTQSVIITLKDSKGKNVITNNVEYTKDSDGNTHLKNENFELADGTLIYRAEHYYDSGVEEVIYYGAEGNILSDEQKAQALSQAEEMMYVYIF